MLPGASLPASLLAPLCGQGSSNLPANHVEHQPLGSDPVQAFLLVLLSPSGDPSSLEGHWLCSWGSRKPQQSVNIGESFLWELE